ncbi:hypothetical protein HU200_031397 [Digitaria exilis]|uniref:Uncharacterized protein n=1 Tax=Digitaria exilis TaxID=1010633 RepID=A0A835EQ75_9POAL|nr:hypothetical protein HU200_031397 [Digitaria exilis]
MALNFLHPGAPRNQPVVDLPAATSAIAIAILNAGVTLLSYHLLPSCKDDVAKTMMYAHYDVYQGANLVTAMLGVALLVVVMAFPEEAAVFRSAVWWHPVVRWIVWVTKVLTGVILTYSLSILYSCLGMYAWPLFDGLSHGFHHHFFLVAVVVILCNIVYFYWVYCSELRHGNIE